jgi:signal peptidase I
MKIRNHLGTVAMVAMAVAWLFVFRPVALGGPASYEIVTGTSMEPHFRTGDLVITQTASSYAVGEIVVYRVPVGLPGAGSIIVHRIVGEVAGGFSVQGDNKAAPDPWVVKATDIVGRSWVEIPSVGPALLVARRPLVIATFIGILGFLMLLSWKPRPKPAVKATT